MASLGSRSAVAGICAMLMAGCASRPTSAVEDLSGARDVSKFVLRSLKGTRDGERLVAQAIYGDGSRSLTVLMNFKVTPPARLESGTWTGLSGEGSVRERSLTFLGGQSGPPSIGGNFELSDQNHRAVYRIHI